MLEYHLTLPKTHRLFDVEPQSDDTHLTFTINHIRSRRPSILYFIFHCYDIDNTEILIDDNPVYISERGVIGTLFSEEGCDYTQTFAVPSSIVDDIFYTQIEMVTLGIDSENPLYFSELMLQTGEEFNGYHIPDEMDKTNSHLVDLPQSMYANLIDGEGNYLQVIRPNKESFNTNNLYKAQYTILAPHFENEDEVDGHIAVFLEALNQTEQRIDVLR